MALCVFYKLESFLELLSSLILKKKKKKKKLAQFYFAQTMLLKTYGSIRKVKTKVRTRLKASIVKQK